jgi:CRISPR system Cascade subunit CasA
VAPWHAFSVQLAALALHRADRTAIPDDATAWRDLLRGLTPAWPDDAPWRLVVDDPTLPAFMQPPIPKGVQDPHKTVVETPDDLDVLVTSRNHGVKQSIAGEATPAAWVAALVALQTSGGFLGAGNYGVARMNGGFATRPQVGLVPPGGPGARWRRDVTVLLANRDWALERTAHAFATDSGHALLWCVPWDGSASLALDTLDPWCIEVCRRVRLDETGPGRLAARTAGSTAARVAAKGLNGNLGDPWIPIDIARGSVAYNTAPRYATVAAVLFDHKEWIRPLMLEWHEGIDPPRVTARFDVLVRGQGTTEGHHVRDVPIEGERRLGFFRLAAEREVVAKLAKEMVGEVRDLRLKVLKPALLTLVQAGKEAVNFMDKTTSAWADAWLDQVERRIDDVFFDHLFARAEDERAGTRSWVAFLEQVAVETFERAAEAMPVVGARRLKAIAIGESRLHGAFRRQFDGLLADEKEPADAG